MMRALLLCLLALVVVPPSAASAYGGEKPAPAFVQALARKADRFWAQRGVPSCASTRTVLMAPSLVDPRDGVQAIGRARPSTWEGGCAVWVLTEDVEMAADPSWFGTAVDLCAVVFHEAGHTGGLEHSQTGLMSPYVGATPFECRTWARRWERRKLRRSWR